MTLPKLLGRGVAALIAALLAFTLAPVPQQAHAAEPAVTLISAHTIAIVGQPVTVRAKVAPVAAGSIGFTEVYANGTWQPSQQTTPNSAGEFSLPLTYGQNQVGVYRFRVGATVAGVTVRTAEFQLNRLPGISLQSAHGSGLVGAHLTARALVTPARAGITGFAQAYVGGQWVRVSTAATTATGQFTVPLSYGISTPGTYRYRLGTTFGGRTVYTGEFNVVRSAGVRLMSAAGSVSVGVTGTARGRTAPALSGYRGFAEVWYQGRWARISYATSTATGDFTVPLSYGAGQAGTYGFRLGAVIGGRTLYTPPFYVTRHLTAANLPATLSGFTRYMEYGSGEWAGAPSGSASVAYWYEGTLNGNFGNLIAANVHNGSISGLDPTLFTGVATYGANRCGTWLRVYTACFVPKGNGFRGVQIENTEFGSRPSHSQVLNLALTLARLT